MSCKDCVHHDACKDMFKFCSYSCDDLDNEVNAEYCRYHKNKTNFVELPCKVGDTVYQIYELFNEKTMEELKVVELTLDKGGIKTLYGMTARGSVYSFDRNYNLDQIKFTKEEAEQKLKGGVE